MLGTVVVLYCTRQDSNLRYGLLWRLGSLLCPIVHRGEGRHPSTSRMLSLFRATFPHYPVVGFYQVGSVIFSARAAISASVLPCDSGT